MPLDAAAYERLDAALARADAALAADYPGDPGTRQPVHTVYVPADRVNPDLLDEWGNAALESMAAGVPGFDDEIILLVKEKLAREPIEDLRADFEDGYGSRPDDEEDADAVRVGSVLRELGTPFCGVRIKNLEPALRRRALRTLDLVLESLAGVLPSGFVVTLPKVTHVDQVSAFVDVLAELEAAHGLGDGALRLEIQVEVPQAILASDGSAAVARMVHAGQGRVSGLHYGTYDYSAAVGIAAPYQSLAHPAADHAKAVMQVAAAGTGVRVCDGSTNVLPVGNATQIRAAWALHAGLVQRSLERGFFQGWDLHPLQLVTRYAATFAFYRAGLPDACERLRAYLTGDSSGVLDEPATARALAALLVRGLHCGALDADEVTARSGVDVDVLDTLYTRR